ncbi:hypothetical protein FB384_001269 [Prauserella sediminis]|uniref:DUF998 domain-containing protein n=1 Tax=Prauserella sediminis TaxID=577680 RepID=A0A839XR29_9PSEU|nr:DUF998 domain-containing protein [Prauserella sediminis]MBB3662365.1 hypothetical protein [Prauserella sediminis]
MSSPPSHAKVHTADVARTRAWTIAAAAGLGWAVFTLVILHSVSSFDPLTDPLSRYAFTDRGAGMLEASLLSAAVGVVAVRGAVLSAGLPVSRTTSTLVYATSTGLVTAALFPATFSSEIDPVSGRIHQYASVVAFASLPAIALSLLDVMRATPVLARVASALTLLLRVALVSLALFGVSYVADALSGVPGFAAVADTVSVGFTQRIVFMVDFGLLAVLLVGAMQGARGSATAPTSMPVSTPAPATASPAGSPIAGPPAAASSAAGLTVGHVSASSAAAQHSPTVASPTVASSTVVSPAAPAATGPSPAGCPAGESSPAGDFGSASGESSHSVTRETVDDDASRYAQRGFGNTDRQRSDRTNVVT